MGITAGRGPREKRELHGTLSFEDGSIASLTYTTWGVDNNPKRPCACFCDERIFVLTNYRKLEIFGGSGNPFTTEVMEKGHFEEMQSFIQAISEGGHGPFPSGSRSGHADRQHG
ncbi:MAG: hypothetical protein GY847_19735 [Proteobacteria bacterium]|nr:hypothetical protein [Pseudomonadota bacterium]